jgi:hypothetical protein
MKNKDHILTILKCIISCIIMSDIFIKRLKSSKIKNKKKNLARLHKNRINL